MNVSLERRRPADSRADVLVIGRHSDPGRGEGGELAEVDRRIGGLISRALAAEKFEGKSGQISYLFTNGKLPRGPGDGGGARAPAGRRRPRRCAGPLPRRRGAPAIWARRG